MGGESSSQQMQATSSKTEPWKKTIPALEGIIGQAQGQLKNAPITGAETSAINSLGSLGNNPYLSQINSLTSDLFGGGKDRTGMVQGSYDTLKGSLTPYTNMDTNPYSNEAFNKATSYMTDDIMNRVKSQYAGAGYSPTGVGDYGKSVGEGVARGIAPTWLQASNDLENRKLGAISGLYGAGNTSAGLLSGMDQNALTNRFSGAGMSQMANTGREEEFRRTLEAEALKRGIPLQALAGISSLIVPMAQLGQQSTGTSYGQGTQQMSGAQQFATIAGGIGAMMPKYPMAMPA
jgi:hypothetical protein